MKIYKSIQHFVLIIALLGLYNSSLSQPDDLELPFKHMDGKARVDVLQQLCFTLLWEKPNRSLEYGLYGLYLSDSLGYMLGSANLHWSVGDAHLYKGDFEKALSNYQQAQYLYDSLQQKTKATYMKGNVGDVYSELGDYKHARGLIEEVITTFTELKDTLGLAINTRRLGHLHYLNNQLDSAESLFRESLSLMRNLNDSLGIGFAYGHLGDIYVKKENWQKAEQYFTLALKVMRNQKVLVGEMLLLQKTANLYENLKEYDKAIRYYSNVIQIANDIEYRSKEMEAHFNISRVYRALSQTELALDHFIAYVNLKDSVINIAKNKKIADLQVRYRTKEQEQKMEELKLQGRFQRLQIVSLAIIATLLITGFWVWYVLKRKAERKLKRQYTEIQRKNQIIKLKREEVELANKELRNAQQIINEKNEELVQVNANLEEQVNERTIELQAAVNNLVRTNEELDTFIYRSSHDIKGPLSTLAGLCLLAVKEIEDGTANVYLQHIQRTVDSTIKQLENLMKVYDIKHMTVAYQEIELEKAVKEVVDCKLLNENYCDATVEVLCTKPVNLLVDIKLIKLVLRNLLDNSMTYYHEHISPKIKIEISQNKKQAIIDVYDNGIGVLPEVKGKVFNMFFRGSEKSVGSGLGLYIAKLALARLDGDLILLSSTSKGSHFRLSIPLGFDQSQ